MHLLEPNCPKCGKGFDEDDPYNLCVCELTQAEIDGIAMDVLEMMIEPDIPLHEWDTGSPDQNPPKLPCPCKDCTDWEAELKELPHRTEAERNGSNTPD